MGIPGDSSVTAALLGVLLSAFLVFRSAVPPLAVSGTVAVGIGYIAYAGSFNSGMDLPPLVALCSFACWHPASQVITATAASSLREAAAEQLVLAERLRIARDIPGPKMRAAQLPAADAYLAGSWGTSKPRMVTRKRRGPALR